jgi:hypothetical protein
MTFNMLAVASAAAALVALAPAAHAATTFGLTIGGDLSGSGSLLADPNDDGSFTVTGASGTIDGNAITGVFAPDTFLRNDNRLDPSSNPAVSFAGISFMTGNGGYNLYGSANGYGVGAPPESLYAVTFELTSAVPEPATWAMMLIGFGMVAAAARGRRRHAGATFA